MTGVEQSAKWVRAVSDDDDDDDMFQHADAVLQSDRQLPGQPPIPADRPRHIVWVDTDIMIIQSRYGIDIVGDLVSRLFHTMDDIIIIKCKNLDKSYYIS